MRTFGLLALSVVVLWPGAVWAQDDEPSCRVIEMDFTPTDDLQIVVWLEDANGVFVETVFITHSVGIYGIGNRPGIMEFNSAWAWPYGRRTTTFPVWAHRHGLEWPMLVFQNLDDSNLSHPLSQSSADSYFCRPLQQSDPGWDTETCASIAFTDKGRFHSELKSLYPPRNDLVRVDGTDSPDVAVFARMNPFDAVTRATPAGGVLHRLVHALPEAMQPGQYVAWVEVNREFDQNEFYDYPAPAPIPWSQYGVPYRGQPSVVYRLPFELSEQGGTTAVESYAGYGDPDGLDGKLREPDGTITENVDGSGASRLLLTVDGGIAYRVRVRTRPSEDKVAPGAIGQLQAVDVSPTVVNATFLAPGNDGDFGTVAGYEVRYRSGLPITADEFDDDGMSRGPAVTPAPSGSVQDLVLADLQPNTNYYIAVRAYDECLNRGPIAVLEATTPRAPSGRVDACFVATAAYGSPMAADVSSLRRFRDQALTSNVPGSLLVAGYYTFGPSLARVIAPSLTLRQLARSLLVPAVDLARHVTTRSPAAVLKTWWRPRPRRPGSP
jgi:hypothetical protein